MAEVRRGDQRAEAEPVGGRRGGRQRRDGAEPGTVPEAAPGQVVVGVRGVEAELLGAHPGRTATPRCQRRYGRITVLSRRLMGPSVSGPADSERTGHPHAVARPRACSKAVLLSEGRKAQVARGDRRRQPDPVGADVEDMAVAVHGAGVDAEHHGAAPAGADAGGGLPVGGEVDGVPGHGTQALPADRVQMPGDRAVVEVRRRGRRGQAEVDRDAVALAGADPAALDHEAPLVVRGDDVVQFRAGEAEAVGGGRRDQRVDLHPAARVRCEPDLLGLVAQVSGEVFRHPHRASFVHGSRVRERHGSRRWIFPEV